MKLVSIIMPTRSGTHDMLRKAVRSILDAPGTNKDDVEILLRMDSDDPERFFVAEQLTKGIGGFCIGPRHSGYTSMGLFVDDLVKMADSKWCWLFDDDAWIEGNWYGPLSGMPMDCAVNSQFYCLGESKYENGQTGGQVGLLIPTELAKSLAHRNPVDDQWLSVVRQKGWTVRQMPNTTYFHDGRAR